MVGRVRSSSVSLTVELCESLLPPSKLQKRRMKMMSPDNLLSKLPSETQETEAGLIVGNRQSEARQGSILVLQVGGGGLFPEKSCLSRGGGKVEPL